MSGANIYYTDANTVLAAAGLSVIELPVNAGWERRARSSGGFPSAPLGVVWHHTASNTTPVNDLAWMIDNCPDAPVGNMLIDRDGQCYLIAAGASNCAGKGGPWTFSRGTCPIDSGNTHCWNIECACDGVGGAYSEATVGAYFAASNALNAHFGNLPDDVLTHNAWAPTRKIDPATAAAVQGLWQPTTATSSGTWSLHDIVTECVHRADNPPSEEPVTDDDINRIATAVWRKAVANAAGDQYSAETFLVLASQAAADTVNYPVPIPGGGTADLWSLIMDTHERVVKLEEDR